jgi:hypothetical protein
VGAVVHIDNATVQDIVDAKIPGFDTHAQLIDLLRAIGFFLTGGNAISGVTSTLSVRKAVGTGFAGGINTPINVNDPHAVALPEQDPITFFTIDQLGVFGGSSAFLDPTNYDNAGTPTTVPNNNNATIKYLYLFANGAMSVLQGQEVFSTFSAAVDASGSETVIVPDILASGILMARIIMKKSATDTTNSSDVRISLTAAVASGGGGGASTTMQQSYDISVAPQVILTAGLGGIEYEDAATPIGSSLFKVSENGGANSFIDVDAAGVTVKELIDNGLTALRAVASDASKKLVSSVTTLAELAFLSGVTSDVQTQIDAKIPTAEKGSNNGVATLDGGGKIPSSQLPSSVMEYLGTWAASTNTPTLADGVGDNGDVYLASDAGTVDFGSGNITFAQGDWVVYSGTIWEKSLNSDSVVSVNTQTGVVVLDADDVSDSATTNKYTTAAEITKLGGIEALATIDQTGAEIKTAYEAEANAYTDTKNTKLDAVKLPSSSVLSPTSGAVNLNWDDATVFSHALSGNTTFALQNQSGGKTISVSFTATGTGTPTFTGVIFPSGNTPDELTSGVKATVTLIDDGIKVLGVFARDFA